MNAVNVGDNFYEINGNRVVVCTGCFPCRRAPYQWLELGPGVGEPPAESVLVLIGRDLDEEELRRGFAACAADGPG